MPESAGKSRLTSKRLIIIFTVAILVLAAIAAGRVIYKQLNPETIVDEVAVNVFVTKVERTDISVSSVYTGQVSSESQVSVIPLIPGKVVSVNVALGDNVTKGDVLFNIDTESVAIQADQAKIQYDAARKAREMASESVSDAGKAVKAANKSLKQAKDALKQAKKAAEALPPGITLPGAAEGKDPISLAYAAVQQTEAMKKQMIAAEKQAKAGFTQADAQYKLAGEGVKAANKAIDNCTITAPVSGVVTALTVQKGGMASQAMPSAVITATDELVVNTSVAENFIGKISKGDEAQIYIRAVSDDMYKGVIKAVIPSPNQGQTTYPVVISLLGKTGELKPGMFAEIYLVTETVEDALIVPSESVIIKSGKECLAVVTKDNKVVFKEVKTGLDNGDMVEILSGVAEGDRVIYEGQHYVSEESLIKIMDDTK